MLYNHFPKYPYALITLTFIFRCIKLKTCLKFGLLKQENLFWGKIKQSLFSVYTASNTWCALTLTGVRRYYSNLELLPSVKDSDFCQHTSVAVSNSYWRQKHMGILGNWWL